MPPDIGTFRNGIRGHRVIHRGLQLRTVTQYVTMLITQSVVDKDAFVLDSLLAQCIDRDQLVLESGKLGRLCAWLLLLLGLIVALRAKVVSQDGRELIVQLL